MNNKCSDFCKKKTEKQHRSSTNVPIEIRENRHEDERRKCRCVSQHLGN